MDGDINEGVRCCGRVDCFEEHGAFVLVEEFWGRVDVVVCSGVGAAENHYCHA